MGLLHFYRTPGLSEAARAGLLDRARARISSGIAEIRSEHCFNVETDGALTDSDLRILTWLLSETFEPEGFGERSFLAAGADEDGLRRGAAGRLLVEVGPRMSFTTAWSTNAVSVCRACGLDRVRRIERGHAFPLRGSRPHDRVPLSGAA